MGDDSFEFENRHGQLSLTRTWSRPAAWAAFTWVLIWSAMVVFFSTLGGHALREAPWFLALPCLAFGAFGPKHKPAWLVAGAVFVTIGLFTG